MIKIYVVRYTIGNSTISCLPMQHKRHAEELRDKISGSWIEERIIPAPTTEEIRCHKCGTIKRDDLFKHLYCPVCNDWS